MRSRLTQNRRARIALDICFVTAAAYNMLIDVARGFNLHAVRVQTTAQAT